MHVQSACMHVKACSRACKYQEARKGPRSQIMCILSHVCPPACPALRLGASLECLTAPDAIRTQSKSAHSRTRRAGQIGRALHIRHTGLNLAR